MLSSAASCTRSRIRAIRLTNRSPVALHVMWIILASSVVASALIAVLFANGFPTD